MFLFPRVIHLPIFYNFKCVVVALPGSKVQIPASELTILHRCTSVEASFALLGGCREAGFFGKSSMRSHKCRSHTFSSNRYKFTDITIATPPLTRIVDRLIREGTNSWEGHHMSEHFLKTTRLTMISQHRGEAQKPRLNCSMNLKGAESSWWCYRS